MLHIWNRFYRKEEEIEKDEKVSLVRISQIRKETLWEDIVTSS